MTDNIRTAMLLALGPEPRSMGEITARLRTVGIRFGPDAIRRRLRQLIAEERACVVGHGAATRYALPRSAPHAERGRA